MKTILAILLVIMTVSSTQPAQAGVGYYVKKKAVKVVGGVTLGASGGIGIWTWAAAAGASEGGVIAASGILISGGVALVGLVILDNKDGSFHLTPIQTIEDQQKLGLSNKEAEAYHHELPVLNAILDEVSSKLTENSTIAESNAAWNEHAGEVSVDAANALSKVMANVVASINSEATASDAATIEAQK